MEMKINFIHVKLCDFIMMMTMIKKLTVEIAIIKKLNCTSFVKKFLAEIIFKETGKKKLSKPRFHA